MIEIRYGPELADSWMYWMTTKDFKNVISEWRQIYTSNNFEDYAFTKYKKDDYIDQYKLLQGKRRSITKAKQLMDSFELISYITRVLPNTRPNLRTDLSTYNGNFVGRCVNNLMNILMSTQKKEYITLRKFIYSDYYKGRRIPSKDLLIMDYLGQMLMRPFAQGYNWDHTSQRQKFDTSMQYQTDGIFHLDPPIYYQSPQYNPAFKQAFDWITPAGRKYLLSEYHYSYFYGSDYIVDRGDITLPVEFASGIIIFPEFHHDSSGERKFMQAVIVHPEGQSDIPIGSPTNFIQLIFGVEHTNMQNMPSPLRLTRDSYHQLSFRFNDYYYRYTDNEQSTRLYDYDNLVKFHDGHYVQIEIDGSYRPGYVISKDLNEYDKLHKGFAPISILDPRLDELNVFITTYRRNCRTIGKQTPLFETLGEWEDFVGFLQTMKRSDYWISDQGHLRPRTFEEILFTLHDHASAWGLSDVQAAKFQATFGIIEGRLTPAFERWWYNYRAQQSPQISFDGPTVTNWAYLHNQYFDTLEFLIKY